MKTILTNLYHKVRWFFMTKKQKEAWPLYPWKWKEFADPEGYYVESSMSKEESEKFLELLQNRKVNADEFFERQVDLNSELPLKPFIKQ